MMKYNKKIYCCYSWFDKVLGLVVCSKTGMFCNRKDCFFKDEFKRRR